MVDVTTLPDPVSGDDPDFEAFLDAVSGYWAANPVEDDPSEGEIDDIARLPMGPGTAATIALLESSGLTALRSRGISPRCAGMIIG